MALVYELKELEKLIESTLHPKNLETFSSDENQILQWRDFAIAEVERIKSCLTECVYNSDERQRELFIQHHQKSLIRLADKVYYYLLPKNPVSIYKLSPGTDAMNLYKEVFKCLEDLLQFIEQNFKDFFNPDEKVTDLYLHITQEGLKSKWKILKQQIVKQKVDKKLLEILTLPILTFCNKENTSYRELMYVKNLTYFIPSFTESGSYEEKLIKYLLHCNFNNGDFVSYCIAKIVDQINVLPEQKDKIRKLMQFQKEYNQLHSKAGLALKHSSIELKEQISFWINEEIHYLEKTQRLLSVVPLIKDDEAVSDDDRLHFSISVHVLGILTRAAHDSKLIINKHGTTVFKNVSKYCRTIQAKHPGADSMDKKSHEAERVHKQKAIVVLQDMIKLIYTY